MVPRALSVLSVIALASASHFTWLPLGDSITWGCGNGFLPHVPNGGCEADAGSYRIPTAQALEQANITVTTVGSLVAAPASAPAAWRAHEGHPGWRIDQLNATARSVWAPLQPQVVTMLVGANDCLQGDGAPVALARMTALLGTTAAALPAAAVLVASILDVPSGGAKTCQEAFNAALPALVAGFGARFSYVPVAENTTGVCGDDKTTWSIGDGVHPNAAGHARVASVFARAMRAVLCPRFETDHAC
jgi:lysophospholipase L1-like esterase